MVNREDFKFSLTLADWIVLGLLIIKLFLIGVFFPELEMPDEAYHYSCITGGGCSNPYYFLMNKIYGFYRMAGFHSCPGLAVNPDFSFASNAFLFIHDRPNCPSGIFLKMFHLVFTAVFMFILYFFLRYRINIEERRKKFIFRLHLLYFSWPAVSFSLMGLSPHLLIYLFGPLFFTLLVYYKRFLLSFLLCSLLAVFVDNNAIFMLVTAICYFCFYLSSKPDAGIFPARKKVFLSLAAAGVCFAYAGLMYSGVVVKILPVLRNYTYPAYEMGYSFIKAHAAVFMSLYYLGGSMSFLAYPLEYLFFIIILVYLLKDLFIRRDIQAQKFFIFFLSCALAFNIILLTIPNLNQGRYYYFFLIVLFVLFDRYWAGDRLIKDDKIFVIVNSLFFVSVFFKLTRLINL